MAESVDAAMDAMVPALQDLLAKGIFTESEIRAIVNRRRQYEYLLRRRQARKADFLAYIEDESKLERLRSLRNRKLIAKKKYEEEEKQRAAKKEQRKTGRHGDKKKKGAASATTYSSIGDASIVQHIHFIYTRAIRKWRDDVSLHLEHAQFAKKAKSRKRLGRIYTEALQVHPHNVELWIEAASHEYFGHTGTADGDDSTQEPESAASAGGSVANARVLLQRGLRVNPRSKDLWLQYFSLELHYIQKLRGRREILQLGLNQKGLAETAADEDDVQSSAQIPLIVFKNAIKSVPEGIQFRLKFVELCRMFPETGGIETFIMSTVDSDFADDPEAWIVRAGYAADAGEHICDEYVGFVPDDGGEKLAGGHSDCDVHHILDEATDTIESVAMYLAAIGFMKRSMDDGTECDSRDVKFLGRLFQKADNAGISSPDLLLEHTRYLVSTGNVNSAVTLLRDVVNDPNNPSSKDARLWLELAQIIRRVDYAGYHCIDLDETPIVILERALERIPIHDDGYINIAVRLFHTLMCLTSEGLSGAERMRRQEKISELFARILLLSFSKNGGRGHNMPELCFMYLQHANMTGGIDAARKAYETVLFKSNYAKSRDGKDENAIGSMKPFFDACISIEQLSTGADLSTKARLRKLYNAAAIFFKHCNQHSIVSEYKKRQNHDRLLRVLSN